MKNIKLLFLMLLLLVTGCSYKYDVSINKKKNVSEKLNIQEYNSIFTSRGSSSDIYIDTNVKIYKNDDSYNKYTFDKKIGDQMSGVVVKASYADFQEYTKNTKVKKSLFGKVELYEDSNYGYFIASDYRGDLFFTDEESEFKNESVEFIFTVPFEVVENNADSYDLENGIYKWKFDKSSVDKVVRIKFDSKKIAVKENLLKKYFYIPLAMCVLFLIIIFVIIKNKRVNKI